MADYWKLRQVRERERLLNTTEEYLKRILKKEYLKLYKEVKARLAELVASYGGAIPTANDLYKEDKFFKLLSEIEFKMDHLAQFEINLMTQTFSDYYVNNSKLLDEAFDIPIDDGRVLRAINQVLPGDGKNFSDRIWTHKRQLVEKLRAGLISVAATGKSWGGLVKELQADFNTSYFNANRLVRTELSRINNQSAVDKYIAEGVKYVRWVATSDCRTCDKCMKLDGQVFPIEKAPTPPADSHIQCRCCLIAVII